MQYVVVLEIDEDVLDGDESIENACRITQESLDYASSVRWASVRPLSEIIAA